MENRDGGITLLKAVAIAGVLIIHLCGAGGGAEVGSANWVTAIFFGSAARASVPIFLMCSGALLLPPRKELTLKKLYLKNLLRIVVALFFWAFVYQISHMKDFSPSELLRAVKDVLLFRHEFHFYYLHIMILVYVFLPITRVFVKNSDKKQLLYFLAVWFALGILFPTLKPFYPFTLLSGFPLQWMMIMSYAAIGYGVLGYYLKTFPPPKRLIAASAAVGFLAIFGGTWVVSVKHGVLYERLLEGMGVFACLLAIGLFGLLSRVKIRSRIVFFLSDASFCVYLVHLLVIRALAEIGLTVGTAPIIVSVPMMFAAVLAGSCAVYAVMSRIPVLKKWLV
ncbi:membrane protein [Clostridia bacterium]|nr:membrane protein [Clostridia bacterium]